ncbi:ATP-binding protein [Henriciella sp. AS95]|uniref:PAS domain-containing sensor histidine kinase n=1 Tax=Henriciella sp. AS95 TaxID=3135782 RepID=UPI00317AAE4B
MARKVKTSPGKSKPAASSDSNGSLKVILACTLLMVAVALGLMSWNAHVKQDREALRLLQRDALIAGERLNRNAEQVIDRLDRKLRDGTRLSRIDRNDVGVDALVDLEQAKASNDAGVVALADAASALLVEGDRLTLLNDGRMMLVHVPASGNAIIATVNADRWIPSMSGEMRVGIYGDATASLGNRDVLPPTSKILQSGSGFRYDGLVDRSATACVDIGKAEFSLCVSRASPLLTAETGIELLLYFLLLAAPTLAIIGMYSNMSRDAHYPNGQTIASTEPSSSPIDADPTGSAGLGVWSVQPETGEARIDRTGAQLLGMTRHGKMKVSDLLSHVYAAHRQQFETAINAARGSTPFSSVFATSMSGGENWIEARASQAYSDDSAMPKVEGVLFDVTETIRTQERQKSAEARLRNAIESFPSPFALWDKNRRLAYWNKSFEAAFGLDGVLRPGTSHETVMLARSGNIINERASSDDAGMSILGLRNGQWIKLVERQTPAGGMVSFGLDVTKDVKSEEELTRQQKKLKSLVQDLEVSEGRNAELARKYNEEKAKAERSADSKSAFLANMSHELRTPLNAINGFSEILVNEMYGPLGHKRYGEYARDILTSGQHLLDMINDILDIAKIEAGKMTIEPKPIDLVDPVDAAVRMIRRKAEDKGITMSLQAENRLPEVDADHRAVRQMVLNLLSNAIKFTDEGGRIMVGVQRRDDFVRVAVRDTGVGIPKEHLPRLAQPFEQVQETRERNYEGTGLGLALTKSFAEMHGGRFTIASEVGKGTMVSFFLPISKDDVRSDRNVA